MTLSEPAWFLFHTKWNTIISLQGKRTEKIFHSSSVKYQPVLLHNISSHRFLNTGIQWIITHRLFDKRVHVRTETSSRSFFWRGNKNCHHLDLSFSNFSCQKMVIPWPPGMGKKKKRHQKQSISPQSLIRK